MFLRDLPFDVSLGLSSMAQTGRYGTDASGNNALIVSNKPGSNTYSPSALDLWSYRFIYVHRRALWSLNR